MADTADLKIKVDSGEVLAGKQALDKLAKSGKKVSKSTKGVTSATKKLSPVLASASKAVKRLALTMGTLATAMKIVTIAKGFEQSIADLSAITGATGKDLKFLSDAAREFGATTTLSASEVAEAFKLVASAKPDLLDNASALKEVTRQTILLAEAAGIDAATAAKVLGTSLNQFGADADEAAKFVNILAAGAKFGSSEISATATALIKAGGAAKSAGISFVETNAAIQLLAAGGQEAEVAGTALKSIFIKLQTQSNSNFNPAIVGLSTAFKNMADAGLNVTEKTKLFGQEAFSMGLILLDKAKEIETFTEKLSGTSTATDQARTKVNTLTGDFKTLSSATSELAIFIGKTLNPVMRIAVQFLTDLVLEVRLVAGVIKNLLTLGLLKLARAFIFVKNETKLLFDALTPSNNKEFFLKQMKDELTNIDSLISNVINNNDKLMRDSQARFNTPTAVADVAGGGMVGPVVDPVMAAATSDLETRLSKEAEIKASHRLIEKDLDQSDLIERKAKNQKELDFKIELLKKEKMARKAAADFSLNLAKQNEKQSFALAKSAASGNKEALIGIVLFEKGLAISRALMNTAVAVTAALTIPPPAGEALAASIQAQGTAQVALIAATGISQAVQISGQADNGMPFVPRSGTFMLEKGERVVKKDDNKELTKALQGGGLGGGATIVVNVDATNSADIETVTRNAAEQGARMGYEQVANDMRRGGPIRMALA